jgi:cytochrome c oxidase assembly protein subunit 15
LNNNPPTIVPEPSAQVGHVWPHRLAVLLVCATFPLIWVGGLVTSFQAGMAVPDWPNTFGYNLFLYPLNSWLYGPFNIFIEHGHRLLGALVGMIMIALLVVIWRVDNRRWLKVLAIVSLLAVIGQGLLGGLRVVLGERLLAMVHGCVGPAFFALAVSLAVFTSRFWWETPVTPANQVEARRGTDLCRLAVLTTMFAYLQLIAGAVVRHMPGPLAPGSFRIAVMFHLLLAVVLVVHVGLLSTRLLHETQASRALTVPSVALVGLILLQVALGLGSWVLKYNWPTWLGSLDWFDQFVVRQNTSGQALMVTAHVANGSLILVTCWMLALRCCRRFLGNSFAGKRRAHAPLGWGVSG